MNVDNKFKVKKRRKEKCDKRINEVKWQEIYDVVPFVLYGLSLHITRRRPVERSETQWERSGTGRSGAVEWREVTRKRSERNHGGHKDSDSLHSSPSRRRPGSVGEAASDVRRRDEPGRDVMDGEEWSGNNNPKAVIIIEILNSLHISFR